MTDVPVLSFVTPTEKVAPLNVLLYGPPGTGKTVAACSAPGPVLVINAEGQSALRYARAKYGNAAIHELAFDGRSTLEDAYRHLRVNPEEKTVVVDSIGEIYTRLLADIGGSKPKIQHYGDVNNDIERFVRSLRDLDLNVVLVCHEQIDDSEEGGATRRPLTGGQKLPEKLMAMMDVVAYCGVIPESEDSPRRWVGQVVEDRGRRAKDRSGALGRVRDLDLSEWISTVQEALAPDPVPFDVEDPDDPGGQFDAEDARAGAVDDLPVG